MLGRVVCPNRAESTVHPPRLGCGEEIHALDPKGGEVSIELQEALRDHARVVEGVGLGENGLKPPRYVGHGADQPLKVFGIAI